MDALKRVLVMSLPLSVLIYLWMAETAAQNGKDPGFLFLAGVASVMAAMAVALGWLLYMAGRAVFTPSPTRLLGPDDGLLLGSIPANQWMGIESRGGRLFFAEGGLVFVPHAFNFQRDQWSIRWTEIHQVGVEQGHVLIIGPRGGCELAVNDPEAVAEGLIALLENPDLATPSAVSAIRGVQHEPPERRVLATPLWGR